MKIIFTGATSFTGFWFVQTLAAAGHELICPTTAELESYSGIRKQRVEKLKSLCTFVPASPFGSEHFVRLAGSAKFDVLCHHAADVRNYKSEDFDAIGALQSNTLNLPALLKLFRCPVVLTGSVFENDEGSGDEPLNAFSPYGLSKGMTYQFFRYHCHKAGVPLGKFVIPNPFGPWEEPRFTAYLMKNWREGKMAEVKTPGYVRDNIHADLLAPVYAAFVSRVAAAKSGNLKINPSGYAGTQGEFTERLAREVKARTKWACEVKLCEQTEFNEPLRRVNSDPAALMVPAWDEKKAWDGFVEFYQA